MYARWWLWFEDFLSREYEGPSYWKCDCLVEERPLVAFWTASFELYIYALHLRRRPPTHYHLLDNGWITISKGLIIRLPFFIEASTPNWCPCATLEAPWPTAKKPRGNPISLQIMLQIHHQNFPCKYRTVVMSLFCNWHNLFYDFWHFSLFCTLFFYVFHSCITITIPLHQLASLSWHHCASSVAKRIRSLGIVSIPYNLGTTSSLSADAMSEVVGKRCFFPQCHFKMSLTLFKSKIFAADYSIISFIIWYIYILPSRYQLTYRGYLLSYWIQRPFCRWWLLLVRVVCLT